MSKLGRMSNLGLLVQEAKGLTTHHSFSNCRSRPPKGSQPTQMGLPNTQELFRI